MTQPTSPVAHGRTGERLCAQRNMTATHTQSFASNAEILAADQAPDQLFIIASGRVDLYRGRERIAELSEGDLVGAESALCRQPALLSAIARTDCQLIALSPEQLPAVLAEQPALGGAMLRHLAGQWRQSLAFQPSTECLRESLNLRLKVVDGPTLVLQEDQVYVVGRADPASGITPDLDLSELGEGHTVSRQHAELHCRDGVWHVVETKATANGTHLNEQRLTAGQASAFSTGDRLTFGLITVEVHTDD